MVTINEQYGQTLLTLVPIAFLIGVAAAVIVILYNKYPKKFNNAWIIIKEISNLFPYKVMIIFLARSTIVSTIVIVLDTDLSMFLYFILILWMTIPFWSLFSELYHNLKWAYQFNKKPRRTIKTKRTGGKK